jgi:dihydrodipicolinate synthase/N-acetylneuraminate lyase
MRSYIPYGVSPAVLLPFDDDLAIDEAAFRKHGSIHKSSSIAL